MSFLAFATEPIRIIFIGFSFRDEKIRKMVEYLGIQRRG
jgi:hypothetical protein